MLVKDDDEIESLITKDFEEKEEKYLTVTSYVINTKTVDKLKLLFLSKVNPILKVANDNGK